MLPLARNILPSLIKILGIILRIPDFPDIKTPSTVLFSCLSSQGLLVMVLVVVLALVEVKSKR